METPGLWILDKNWRDRMNTFDKHPNRIIEHNGVLHEEEEDTVPITVGVLGSGQVFSELAILDPEKSSPVSIVSCTNMELYSFDSATLISLGARYHATTINALNESTNLCNPPGDKVAFYFRSKFDWEKRKSKLLHGLGHEGFSSTKKTVKK